MRPISQINTVEIRNFWGMNSQRDPAAGEDYGLGALSVNQGRFLRRPLEPRVGLKPLKSSNDNHELAGTVFSMVAMPHASTLSIVMRLSGGRLVAARDVEPDTA